MKLGKSLKRFMYLFILAYWKGKVILFSFQIPTQSQKLQSGVRQFLHRMVVCLEEELLPYIPQASEGLLKGSDIQSIQEYIPLIVQIIAKFKVS
jgi:exportin-T